MKNYATLFLFVLLSLEGYSQVISNSGAFANIAAGTVVNGGSIGNSGTITNSGAITLTSGLTNSATINGNGNYNIGGNWVNNGTFTAGTSLVTFNGSIADTISGTSATTFNGLTVNSPGQILTMGIGNSITVSGPFTQTSGTINLNGNTLALNGAVTLPTTAATGVFTGSSTSSIMIGGTGSITNSLFMDQTSSSSNALSNLTLNNSGATLTLGNALNIIDSISPTSGTIAGGGNITLIADQTTVGHTGRVGVVGGTLTGNITSQVFHNPPTGNTTNWVLMGSAGITGQDFTQWDSAFQITCPTCPDGSAPGGTTFTSVDSYVEADGAMSNQGFVGINNITDPMTIGLGYWVYMGTTNDGTASASELISVTGPAQTGNFTWPTLTNTSGAGSNEGNNLIANPYPSPISWNKVMAEPSNAGAAALGLSTIYAYSSTYDGGDYMTYNSSSGISVPSYTPGTNSIADVIPAGMGFYVITSSNNATLNVTENDKVSGNNQNFLFKQTHPNSVQSSSTAYFSLVVTGGSNNYSEAAISFNPNGTLGFDVYDAPAITWNYLLQISTQSMGKNYTINGLPALTQNYTIPVQILSGTTTQYALTPTYLNNIASGVCLNLHDNYTGTDYDLRAGAINLTINDTETVPRFVLTISTTGNPSCGDSHSDATGIKAFAANENNIQISRDAVGYYVQFNYPDKTNAVISVQNLLGEKVIADINQDGVSTNKTYIPMGTSDNNVLIISVVTTAGEKTFRKVINSN